MKVLLVGQVYNTKNYSELELQARLQERLDAWLGKDTVKVKVLNLENKRIELQIFRRYGDWYEDPDKFFPKANSIFQLDEQLILGEGYQSGTIADLSVHECKYVVLNDVQSIFLPKYRRLAKENHCSRIKNLQFDDHLDYFYLNMELV